MTSRARILLAAAVAVVAVSAGAAVGVAQTRESDDRAAERDAFLADVAGRLDVSVDRLREALKGASLAHVQRLLDAGDIDATQAERLRAAIEAGRVPGFTPPKLRGRGGHGFGPPGGGPGGRLHHGLFGSLDAAAEYLGLTREQLRTRLAAGESLAAIARAEGKSVEGLVQALLADARARLEAAAEAGRLDAARLSELLERLEQRLEDFVERARPAPGPRGERRRSSSGPGPFGGPPPEPLFAA